MPAKNPKKTRPTTRIRLPLRNHGLRACPCLACRIAGTALSAAPRIPGSRCCSGRTLLDEGEGTGWAAAGWLWVGGLAGWLAVGGWVWSCWGWVRVPPPAPPPSCVRVLFGGCGGHLCVRPPSSPPLCVCVCVCGGGVCLCVCMSVCVWGGRFWYVCACDVCVCL